MTQATHVIEDGNGLAVRTALNAALAALASGNSGTTYPAYLVAGELVWRTDVPGSGVWTLFAWDGAAGGAILTLDTATHEIALADTIFAAAFGSTKGMLLKHNGTKWTGLAVGSALQGLRVNAAGDDLEFGEQPVKLNDLVITSSTASAAFTGIPSSIKGVDICVDYIRPVTNQVALLLQLYDDTGTLLGPTTNYYTIAYGLGSDGGVPNLNLAGGFLCATGMYNATPAGGGSGLIRLNDLQSAVHKRVTYHLGWIAPSAEETVQGQVRVATTSKIGGWRLYFNSGSNVAEARISTWGRR